VKAACSANPFRLYGCSSRVKRIEGGLRALMCACSHGNLMPQTSELQKDDVLTIVLNGIVAPQAILRGVPCGVEIDRDLAEIFINAVLIA
jgi:hypothetical protein